mmetsp:Transcript_26404/g.58128  ORF Transcript_26404/g.58128 Transcript_26404/m.58128 type:complete len:256 (+) Transcript_26404:492-1259(+)
MEFIKSCRSFTNALLDSREFRIGCSQFARCLPHHLSEREPSESMQILVATGDDTLAAYSITIQRNRVKTISLGGFLAELHSSAYNSAAKHLLNSRENPIRTTNHLRQRFDAFKLGNVKVPRTELVEWCHHNLARACCSHHLHHLPCNLIIFRKDVEQGHSSKAFHCSTEGSWDLDEADERARHSVSHTLLLHPCHHRPHALAKRARHCALKTVLVGLHFFLELLRSFRDTPSLLMQEPHLLRHTIKLFPRMADVG